MFITLLLTKPNKTMKFNVFLVSFATLTLISLSSYSQLNPQGVAPGLIYTENIADLVSFPFKESIDKLLLEDELGINPDLPERVAISIPVHSDLFSLGKWFNLPDGRRFFQARITSPSAYSLVLAFDKFFIPENGQLFFYSPDKETYYGGYTSDDNHESMMFPSPIISGDEMVIEYFEPNILENSSPAVFHIMELAHFYKPSNESFRNSNIGASDACHINMNCPEGNEWQTQKRGIARMLMKVGSGWSWCSGTLINNTAQDGTPYFLTAEHCGGSASAADRNQWVFRFNFERPECADAGIPATQNITGSSLIAKGLIDGGSDMQLIRLNFTPPASFQPYYNGWERRATPPNSGVGIHHPSGDVKKISTYSATATSVANPIISGTQMASHSAWNIFFVSTVTGHSVTQGGSSGSPMFNQNKLITGTLTGGSSSCTNPNGNNIYGKFSYHWESNGTEANKQLRPWLDPLGTGQVTLEGLDPYPVPVPRNLSGEVNQDHSVTLSWEKPKYNSSDGWFSHATSYTNVRHETPERAVKFDLVNSLDIDTFYIKKVSHLFWEHPSFPWGTNNTFTFKIYGENGQTLLYESEVITAVNFQTTNQVVEHTLPEPIATVGGFYIAIAPVQSGQPSSLSLKVTDQTNSFFGSPGNWNPFVVDNESFELLINVYGSDFNPAKSGVQTDELVQLGPKPIDWLEAAQPNYTKGSKVITNLRRYNIYRDDELIFTTSDGEELSYTDNGGLVHHETYSYYLRAIYNLNPPTAPDIVSDKSNEIDVLIQPVGIDPNQSADSRLTVYPNPTSSIITIKLPSNVNKGLLTIKDITGRIIESSTFLYTPDNITMDLSGYNPGLYIIELQEGKTFFTGKIIVQ